MDTTCKLFGCLVWNEQAMLKSTGGTEHISSRSCYGGRMQILLSFWNLLECEVTLFVPELSTVMLWNNLEHSTK